MRKKDQILGYCFGLAIAIMVCALSGCGGGSSDTAAVTREYLGTQAPGDVWQWNISESTFTATNETLGYDYSGTAESLPSGFKKLTIGATTDPDVTVGSDAYAIEIPGVCVLVKPAGGDDEPPIMATGLGVCPEGPTVAFNWVTVPHASWDNSTDEAYGTASFAVSGEDFEGTIEAFKADGTALGSNVEGFSCVDGRLDVSGPGDSVAAITEAGVVMIDHGPGEGGVIGVQQLASNVDLVDIANKEFRGILVSAGNSEAIYGQPNGTGGIRGGNFDDIEAGTKNLNPTDGVTIELVSQPSPGLIRATLQELSGGPLLNIIFVCRKVGDKYILFGLGEDSGGYNVLMVEHS